MRLAGDGRGSAFWITSAGAGSLESIELSVADRQGHRESIRKEAEPVVGRRGGADLLHRLFLAHAGIERAGAPDEKIRLCGKSRDLQANPVSPAPAS